MAYVGDFMGNSALFNCPNNSLIATSYAIKTDQFVGGFKQFDRLLVGVLGFVETHDGLENFEVERLCPKIASKSNFALFLAEISMATDQHAHGAGLRRAVGDRPRRGASGHSV